MGAHTHTHTNYFYITVTKYLTETTCTRKFIWAHYFRVLQSTIIEKKKPNKASLPGLHLRFYKCAVEPVCMAAVRRERTCRLESRDVSGNYFLQPGPLQAP